MSKGRKSKYYGSVQYIADLALVDIQCMMQFVTECKLGKTLRFTSKETMQAFSDEMYRLAKDN